MPKATTGSSGAFTYDFGIQIAQTTVNRLQRTAASVLSLASAYYALNKQAGEYLNTLRSQQLFFGGQANTMKAIADAQDRIIKGTSRFSVKDQLEGINNLAKVGIDARKEMEWTEKAAHAMGMSYSQFSNAIANGIRGNMSGLVEMGLITERATRAFEKYQGNTVMRQQAILNFVKNHKALQQAIKNDFETVQDQMHRMKGVWQAFLQSILGAPNDPGSFLGQANLAFKEVAEGFARNAETIKRYGFQIGQILGWVIRNVGHFVTWVGRQVMRVVKSIWKVTDDYAEAVRSVVVWLEFQKRVIVDFFEDHAKAIKFIIKWLLIYAVAKKALMIGTPIIKSVYALGKAIFFTCGALVGAIKDFGIFRGILHWFTGFLPPAVSGMLVKVKGILIGFVRILGGIGKAIWASLFGSNPVGWAVVAIGAAIAGLIVLYKKSEAFRNFVNDFLQAWVQGIRLVYNTFIWLYVQIRVLLIKFSNWWKNTVGGIKGFLAWLKQDLSVFTGTIQKLWDTIMNTAVGRFIKNYIIDPITTFYKLTLKPIFDGVARMVRNIKGWFTKGADFMGQSAAETAEAYGFSAPVWNNPFGGSQPQSSSTSGTAAVANNPNVTVNNQVPSPTGNPATAMTFNNGAIQIVLNKADGINEQVLADKVRQVILDMEREGAIRGGRA